MSLLQLLQSEHEPLFSVLYYKLLVLNCRLHKTSDLKKVTWTHCHEQISQCFLTMLVVNC